MSTHAVELKPSDFIRPPFKRCPQCGEDSYGIWAIAPEHYLRKCKRCLHPAGSAETFALPPLHKKVIYLDQLLVSEMMKAANANTKAHKSGKTDQFWQSLYGQLARLCRAQLVVCPKSEFHRDESLVSPFPQELRETYESLAQGLAYYDRDSIKVLQAAQNAKSWLAEERVETLPLDPQSIIDRELNAWPPLWHVSCNVNFGEDVKAAIRQGRDRASAGLHEKVFPRWQRQRESAFETILAEEIEGCRVAILETALNHYRAKLDVERGVADPSPESLMPPLGVEIINAVRKMFLQAGVPFNHVLQKFEDYLFSATFGETPFVKLNGMIWATIHRALSKGGQKKSPGRGIGNDVEMISLYLPYCDVMFVDNKIREYLRQQPVCETVKSFNTLMFSPNCREGFVSYLDEIESNASEGHMQSVREVFVPL
jgi:hypothetical protein